MIDGTCMHYLIGDVNHVIKSQTFFREQGSKELKHSQKKQKKKKYKLAGDRKLIIWILHEFWRRVNIQVRIIFMDLIKYLICHIFFLV